MKLFVRFFLVWFNVIFVCFKILMLMWCLLFNLYNLSVIFIGRVWLFIWNEDWKMLLMDLGYIKLLGLIRLNILVFMWFFFIMLLKEDWKWLFIVCNNLLLIFCFKLLFILEKWFMLIRVML